MNPALIQAILIHLAIPELGRWLARRGTDTAGPTDAEMIAQLRATVDRHVALGETFLRLKGIDPATGQPIVPDA